MTNENLYLMIEKAADNLMDLAGAAKAVGENDLARDASTLYAGVLDLKAKGDAPAVKANVIVKVEIELSAAGFYEVHVTKAFAPEYGGGTQIFHEYCGYSLHQAMDTARGMVTVSPGEREAA